MTRYRWLLCALMMLCPSWARPDAPSDVEGKCQALLRQWKARFDAEKFSYVVAPPFVIAGNASAQKIAAYRDRTILSATKCLQKQFFKKKPTEPVLILLFETEFPYKRIAKKWFDDDEVPYYGFFRADNVMLM